VAIALFHPAHPGRLLTVLRPPWDPHLPGIWGLPATGIAPGETPEEALHRCLRIKLGLPARRWALLGEGWQEEGGPHRMLLYGGEAERDVCSLPPAHPGDPITLYVAWRWATPEALEEGARRGSLCCRLFLAWSAGRHGDSLGLDTP
jgi:8-oxo-dGTP pyrophosphatase MutT (NUDIX family)